MKSNVSTRLDEHTIKRLDALRKRGAMGTEMDLSACVRALVLRALPDAEREVGLGEQGTERKGKR